MKSKSVFIGLFRETVQMTVAILYKWRIKPNLSNQFVEAWSEGTKLIHQQCGSYGARLHKEDEDIYWSYAVWPDEESRKLCFNSNITQHPSFNRMREAVEEYYGETELTFVSDLLD